MQNYYYYLSVHIHKQEKELKDSNLDMDQAFYDLSTNHTRTVVLEYCKKNSIENKFNKFQQMAGRDFCSIMCINIMY